MSGSGSGSMSTKPVPAPQRGRKPSQALQNINIIAECSAVVQNTVR